MIKFFRHIRKQLLGEGKTSKYLKYAIGEIILVVIGILIALSINNWNETRKEQASELDYLIGIKDDLENDVPRIENRINGVLRKISYLHKIDPTFIPGRNIEPHDIISLDSINIDYMFNRGPIFRLNSITYKTLTSNASAGLIKNKQLLPAIQNLYDVREPATSSVYDDLKRREEYVGWKYAEEVKNLNLQEFFIDNPNKKEVLADFAFYYKQQALMCRHLLNVKDIMLNIIDNINTEVNNRR